MRGWLGFVLLSASCVAPAGPLDGEDRLLVETTLVGGPGRDVLHAVGFARDGSSLLVVEHRGDLRFRQELIADRPGVAFILLDQYGAIDAVHDGSDLDVVRVARSEKGWLIGGGFSGRFELPSGDVLASRNGYDAVLFELDASGVLWTDHFAADGDTFINGIVTDVLGNIYVAGRFAGDANIAGATLSSNGLDDGYVAQLTSSGSLEWIQAIGGSGRETIGTIAVTPYQGVYVTGAYDDALTIGPFELDAPESRQPFIAQLDPYGTVQMVQTFVARGNAEIVSLAVDDITGAVWTAGTLTNQLEIAGVRLQSRGQTDVFVARFDRRLAPMAARSYGDDLLDVVQGIAIGRDRLWLVGSIRGQNPLAGGTWREGDDTDAFISSISEDLESRFRLRIGGTGAQVGAGVGIAEDGVVTVVGEAAEQLSVGNVQTIDGDNEVFRIRFRP